MIGCFPVAHLSPTGGESTFQKWLELMLLIFISREIPWIIKKPNGKRGTWYENNPFLSALKITAGPGFHPCNSNVKILDVYSLLYRFFYFVPPKGNVETFRKYAFALFFLLKNTHTHNEPASKKKAFLLPWSNRCCLWPWDLRANLFLFTCVEFLGFASVTAAVGNEWFWKYMND